MIIDAQNIYKTYKSVNALTDVSVFCCANEICGLVGANGAGKTTLFKILLGLVTADSGSVSVASEGKKIVGGIIEKPALYEYLNAHDNLKVFSKMQGSPYDKNTLYTALEKVGLGLDRKDPVKNFSMGMKQRLGIAIALLNNPKCLILDEPFSGLDPLGIAALQDLIFKLAAEQGLAIFISSHILDELSKTCSRLYIIKNGKIINQGPTQQILFENTISYTIYAPNISESKTLKTMDVKWQQGSAKVQVSSQNISTLLKELMAEDISVVSCIPETPIEQLFETEKL